MKHYTGVARDHSISMRPLRNAAKDDYNTLVEGIRTAVQKENIDTILSVVRFGVGGGDRVVNEITNSSVMAVRPLTDYDADGQATNLWDGVGAIIDILEKVPDAGNPDVTFLVIAVTDGEENNSSQWSAERLRERIRHLQNTDRWTFVFRVPPGYGANLCRLLGVPSGNVEEWTQTERGFRESTVRTQAAVSDYYSGLSRGVRSSKGFYTDLRDIRSADVRGSLTPITHRCMVWDVPSDAEGRGIRQFVEKRTGGKYLSGAAFYELVKSEEVQHHKQVIIRDRTTGVLYGGREARELLGLPHGITTKVKPGDHGQWDVFVQSTSVNRNLPGGTRLVYWTDGVLSQR